MKKNNWEKEFDKEFSDKDNYFLDTAWPNDVKRFIKSQKELSVRETLDRIELKRKEDKWNDNNSETWNVEFIEGYNLAVSDLDNIKKKIRDENT